MLYMNKNKLPVLFLIFNRKDVSIEAFKEIKKYNTDRLYIAADGPRPTKRGEKEKCEATRQAVLDMIDWPCEVKTLFRTENLGCADAVNGAISWFFDNEKFGVIIEDDVIVSQDFFHLCEELGSRFMNDEKIMMINALYVGKDPCISTSYGFSNTAQVWGWATWRRAWQQMDMSMSRFPKNGVLKHIKAFGIFKGLMLYFYYWQHDYRLISSGGSISSWATRWAFNIFASNGLIVVPQVNLAENIGCTGTGGAHYSKEDIDPYSHLKIMPLNWPLKHPEKYVEDKNLKRIERYDFLRIRLIGLKKKLKI